MKNIPTKELVAELTRRHGIELHSAKPFGSLKVFNRYSADRDERLSPYVLLITQDAYDSMPDSSAKPGEGP